MRGGTPQAEPSERKHGKNSTSQSSTLGTSLLAGQFHNNGVTVPDVMNVTSNNNPNGKNGSNGAPNGQAQGQVEMQQNRQVPNTMTSTANLFEYDAGNGVNFKQYNHGYDHHHSNKTSNDTDDIDAKRGTDDSYRPPKLSETVNSSVFGSPNSKTTTFNFTNTNVNGNVAGSGSGGGGGAGAAGGGVNGNKATSNGKVNAIGTAGIIARAGGGRAGFGAKKRNDNKKENAIHGKQDTLSIVFTRNMNNFSNIQNRPNAVSITDGGSSMIDSTRSQTITAFDGGYNNDVTSRERNETFDANMEMFSSATNKNINTDDVISSGYAGDGANKASKSMSNSNGKKNLSKDEEEEEKIAHSGDIGNKRDSNSMGDELKLSNRMSGKSPQAAPTGSMASPDTFTGLSGTFGFGGMGKNGMGNHGVTLNLMTPSNGNNVLDSDDSSDKVNYHIETNNMSPTFTASASKR